MFDSCSAYQSCPEILFLSQCVPNPPNKGERIRAFHLLSHLAGRYRVHLVCFARHAAELDSALELGDRCASIYTELLPLAPTLAGAGMSFARGRSLVASFYSSSSMGAYIEPLAQRISATVGFSCVMAPLAPPHVPLLMDMVDVDSQKWLDYSKVRHPEFLYSAEGRRLRRLEAQAANRARWIYLTTQPEVELLSTVAPDANIKCIENGVDFDYFSPADSPSLDPARKYVAFVGMMDYYPNVDACRWFASDVFPALRRRMPGLEFLIVGRNPSRAIKALATQPGITVTGGVDDVRPYLKGARAIVAPLRIARGVQNKVLEALAMGKRVFASTAVARTFGSDRPVGIEACASAPQFIEAIARNGLASPECRPEIRLCARRRFSWESNMRKIAADLEAEIMRRQHTGVTA